MERKIAIYTKPCIRKKIRTVYAIYGYLSSEPDMVKAFPIL